MRPFVVARRPDNKQHLPLMPTNALKAQLAIGYARIFSGQQVTIKETWQRRQINAVLGNVRLTLGFVVSNHSQIVDALCPEVKENCRCN